MTLFPRHYDAALFNLDRKRSGTDVIGTRLFVLLACLFVVMIGFGITLPVLPFYVERLAQAEGATREAIVLHVTLLTAVYRWGSSSSPRCGDAGQIERAEGPYC